MPNLFPLQPELIQAFLLIFTRVTATLAFMPILGGQALPAQVKGAFSLLITIVLFPLIDVSHIPVDVDVFLIGLFVFGEALIGVATAMVVSLIFSAVQLAGAMIDFQIGFGIVNVVDPVTNAQVSVTGQLLNITAMLIFMALNAHHWALIGLAEGFEIVPVCGFSGAAGLIGIGEMFMDLMGAVYVTGMQIAAPVTVTLLLKQAAMGVIARTVPQINIFIVGFPLTIGLGMLTVAFTLPAFSKVLAGLFMSLGDRMRLVMALLA